MTKATADNRLSELDSLRGIAAISVMFYHYLTEGGLAEKSISLPGIDALKYGVNLFFGISGFVILMTLTRTNNPVEFAISRFSRLFPVFWFSVTLTWLWVLAMGLPGREVGFGDYCASMTMNETLINVLFGLKENAFKPVDGVYWTLQIELFFYVLALLIHTAKIATRPLLWAPLWSLLGFISLLGIARGNLAKAASFFLILDWADFFIIGTLTYLIWSNRASLVKNLSLMAGIIVIHGFKSGVASAGWLTLVASLLLAATLGRWAIFRLRFFIFLGAISYPLYLIHQNIGLSLILKLTGLGMPRPGAIGITACLIILLAWALHSFIEKPGSEWLKKWLRSKLMTQCDPRQRALSE